MRLVRTVLVSLEKAASVLVGVLMAAVMFTVSLDVLMRYGFNAPLIWAYDFVSLYAMAGIFFLALAPSYRERAHVGVDVLIERLPPQMRVYSDFLGDIVGILVFIPICVYGFDRTWVSFVNGDVLAGLIPWPTWLFNGAVPLGAGLFSLRLVNNAVANFGRIRRGEANTDHLNLGAPE